MAKVKEFDKYKNFENLFFKKTRQVLPGADFIKQNRAKKKVPFGFTLKDTFLRSFSAILRIAFVFSFLSG